MDLIKAIRELQEHKKQLDQAIATLEALQNGAVAKLPSRRGRKEMSEEERRVVSERMSRYWAARRKQQDKGGQAEG
jgi:DNA invertase Pin-like site-specific DNA recombinase